MNERGLPMRPYASVCERYLRAGACECSAGSPLNHPNGVHEGGVKRRDLLNTSGYPLNAESKECSFFIMTGICCSGGIACRLAHPNGKGPLSARVPEGMAKAADGDEPYSPV
eukprot:gnl/TRDRNA2_/TRDRNA2_163662_c0_seq1.p1 gnl/TRDRNA2_/TRDRNA2_163662_c0~~gnl/TRDRNA2_/TRDRNA2_163662_c0_seq1.p1  ORF type:complete len:112 (+),score=7.18 gnl/TRDRNA2_/TRDRNA2_163662_c0_seq1:1-336(+)